MVSKMDTASSETCGAVSKDRPRARTVNQQGATLTDIQTDNTSGDAEPPKKRPWVKPVLVGESPPRVTGGAKSYLLIETNQPFSGPGS